MADETVTLFLPCDVLRFRATIDSGSGVSPIQEIVLQTLAACPLPVQDLIALLALPRQVLAEVVHTLWQLGHLAVEPSTGKLRVTQEALDAVTADRMAALNGSEREECRLDLMVDLLLGQVLPPGFGLRVPREQRVDPPRDGADLDEIPTADLWRAATRVLGERRGADPRDSADRTRNRRVVDLHPEPGRPSRRWRPVLVQPWFEESTGMLGVTVVDPRVPPAFRETGSARLTQLVADDPIAPFTGLLRAHAVSGTPAAPTAESLIDVLTERVARLPGLPAGQRIRHHAQLTEAAAQLAQTLELRIRRETEVELVTGRRQIQAAVDLIDRSHIQVVVVASRLDPAVLRTIGRRLRAALERGVQVVVLLEDEQPSAALQVLARAGGPTPLVMPRQPTRARAGLVVSDDEAALVLSGTAPIAGDVLGILLSAPDGGACPAVRTLLSWVGSVAPDWTTAKSILLRSPERGPDTAPLEAVRLDRLPEAPPSDDTGHAAVAAWEAAWRAYATWQRETLKTRPLPQVRWDMGAHNQEILWQALRTARRRLVIASPLVSDPVVDDRFLALLRERLEHGVMVTLAYRSTDGFALAALDALAGEFPGTLFLVEAPAKTRALVWDDDALLLAAHPLAGDLLAEGPAGSRTLLGLRLTGPSIADRIASATGESPIVTARVTGTETSDARPELLARIQVFNTAQRIRNRWYEERSIERALEPLTVEDDPWLVLESLIGDLADSNPPPTPSRHLRGDGAVGANADAVADVVSNANQGMGDDLVCAAAAWCLTSRVDTADAATVDRWRQWLIQYHWQAGRFAEAALLRLAHPPAPAPRPPLTVVAAAFGTNVSTMALLMALEDEERLPPEDACLLSVAAAESLRTADDDHAEIVGKLIPRVATPWRDLGAAVLEYHDAARGIPPELLLRPAADHAARSRRLDTAWDALARTIDRAQRTQANFIDLKRLQVALFKRSEPFGLLEAATARRDADAVRAFLSSHSASNDTDDQMVGRIIDQVWARAAASSMELQGGPRKALVSRLVTILAAARTVLESDEQASRHQTSTAASAHQEAARVLTERIRDLSRELDTAAARLGYPETELAMHALERISRMTEPETP